MLLPYRLCPRIYSNSASSSYPGLEKDQVGNAHLADVVQGGRLADPRCKLLAHPQVDRDDLRVPADAQGMLSRLVVAKLSDPCQALDNLRGSATANSAERIATSRSNSHACDLIQTWWAFIVRTFRKRVAPVVARINQFVEEIHSRIRHASSFVCLSLAAVRMITGRSTKSLGPPQVGEDVQAAERAAVHHVQKDNVRLGLPDQSGRFAAPRS